MIDKCSLLSAELLSEIDAALCFAKEVADEWFGGITVIFAGDFFQYPPVLNRNEWKQILNMRLQSRICARVNAPLMTSISLIAAS